MLFAELLSCDSPDCENQDRCEQGYCAALSTDANKLIGLPNPSPSLIPPETFPTAECVRSATWHTAATACINIGARLCTQAELQNNEAANTGCFDSDEMVWSSEDVECALGQHMAICGYSGATESVASACTDDSASIGIRCCADVDNHGSHLCIDPSAPTAPGLLDDLGNARSEMTTGMAEGTTPDGNDDEAAMQSGALESLTGSSEQLDDQAQDASLAALNSMVNPSEPDTCYEVRCANPDECKDDPQYCAPSLELHEVRCCSDMELQNWEQYSDCTVWGTSQPNHLVLSLARVHLHKSAGWCRRRERKQRR